MTSHRDTFTTLAGEEANHCADFTEAHERSNRLESHFYYLFETELLHSTAILREIEGVLLELGTGFAFVARQKRMSVGKDDFHLDLLFYHRHLRRLIAVELKLESFQPAHVGQMELYLRWLDKHERAPGEEAPIGLILCAAADAEQVELLQLDAKSIRVSEYLTALPPLPLLRERLHQAMEHAREQAARRLPEPEGRA